MMTFSLNDATKEAAFRAAGFTELSDIFNDNGTVKMTYGELRKALIEKYDFTDGQIAGTIRRACKKQLIFAVGNAEYILNLDFPFGVSNYITGDESSDTEFSAGEESEAEISDNTLYRIKSVLLDMVEEIATSNDFTSASVDDLINIRKLCLLLKKETENAETRALLNTVDYQSIVNNINNDDTINDIVNIMDSFLDTANNSINIIEVCEEELICIRNLLSDVADISCALHDHCLSIENKM